MCGISEHVGLIPAGEGEKDLIWWLVVLIYVVTLFVYAGREISSASYTSELLTRWLPQLTGAQIKQCVFLLRKTGHVAAYGLLTWIVYYATLKTSKSTKKALPLAIVFAFLVACLDERYQSSLAHRTGARTDVVIDGIGILVVTLGILLTKKRKNRQSMEDEGC